MIKKFLEWIKLKEKLHESAATPPNVKERDLWWMSFGENVGSEERRVLVCENQAWWQRYFRLLTSNPNS